MSPDRGLTNSQLDGALAEAAAFKNLLLTAQLQA